MHLRTVRAVANFFDCKLYTADLQNIAHLHLIVLFGQKKVTYNFILVVFHTANNQVHVFIQVVNRGNLFCRGRICALLVYSRGLQIESAVGVYDFEERLVISFFLMRLDLLVEVLLHVVRDSIEFVFAPHDNHWLVGPHRLLGEMATFVVKETV